MNLHQAMMKPGSNLSNRIAAMFQLNPDVFAEISQARGYVLGRHTYVLATCPECTRPSPSPGEKPLMQEPHEFQRKKILVLPAESPPLAFNNVQLFPFV